MPPSTIPSTFNATSSPAPHCGYSAPKRLLTGKTLSQPHDARPVFRSQCVRVIVAVTKRAKVLAEATLHNERFRPFGVLSDWPPWAYARKWQAKKR